MCCDTFAVNIRSFQGRHKHAQHLKTHTKEKEKRVFPDSIFDLPEITFDKESEVAIALPPALPEAFGQAPMPMAIMPNLGLPPGIPAAHLLMPLQPLPGLPGVAVLVDDDDDDELQSVFERFDCRASRYRSSCAPGAEEPGPLQPADEDDPPALPDE